MLLPFVRRIRQFLLCCRLNSLLNKQLICLWLEMSWLSCNGIVLQYIPRNMHTVFALLCFVVVIHWLIFPYPSGLLHWHCGNLTIAPVPAKQPWWIWINTSCEFIMNDCITTTKQSTTKPCAYFLGYTVDHLSGANETILKNMRIGITYIWFEVLYKERETRQNKTLDYTMRYTAYLTGGLNEVAGTLQTTNTSPKQFFYHFDTISPKSTPVDPLSRQQASTCTNDDPVLWRHVAFFSTMSQHTMRFRYNVVSFHIMSQPLIFNQSPPGQNGRHFANSIFIYIFVNGKFCISIQIKFVPKGLIDNNEALV